MDTLVIVPQWEVIFCDFTAGLEWGGAGFNHWTSQ